MEGVSNVSEKLRINMVQMHVYKNHIQKYYFSKNNFLSNILDIKACKVNREIVGV